MRTRHATHPGYTPSSTGGPVPDAKRAAEVHWAPVGDTVRRADALRSDDDRR